MRKWIVFIVCSLLFLVGCGNMANTPTKKVEELFAKYQKVDNDISTEVTDLVKNNTVLTINQQAKYKNILERQYRNLTYRIKDETINGDKGTVMVEIEVYDYKNAILKHEEEYSVKTDFTNEEYNDAKIKRLEETNEIVKYTLTIPVTKVDSNWEVDGLTDETLKKIQGMS